MSSVQLAVLEFDASVRAPWRPPLDGRRGLRLVPPPGSPEGEAAVAPAAPTGRQVSVRRAAGSPSVRRGSVRAPLSAGERPRRPSAAPGRRVPASRRLVGGGASCASPGGSRTGAVRLTRRGRRLLAVLLLGGGVALAAWITPLVTAGGGADLRLTGESSVVVEQGDSLWSIAASVAGEGDDVRAVVDRIQELNGLSGSAVLPGQVLELP